MISFGEATCLCSSRIVGILGGNTVLHANVAFDEPCSYTHLGMKTVHDGTLEPSINQCWATFCLNINRSYGSAYIDIYQNKERNSPSDFVFENK